MNVPLDQLTVPIDYSPILIGKPGGSFIWTKSLNLLKCFMEVNTSSMFSKSVTSIGKSSLCHNKDQTWTLYKPEELAEFHDTGTSKYTYYLFICHTNNQPVPHSVQQVCHLHWEVFALLQDQTRNTEHDHMKTIISMTHPNTCIVYQMALVYQYLFGKCILNYICIGVNLDSHAPMYISTCMHW